MKMLLTVAFAATSLVACKKEPAAAVPAAGGAAHKEMPASEGPAKGGEAAPGADHGTLTQLGSVGLGEWKAHVALAGELSPGGENAFQVKLEGGPKDASTAGVSVYLTVEDATGAPISAPTKGSPEKGGLHFHLGIPAGSSPSAISVRLRAGDFDARERLEFPKEKLGTPVGPHGGLIVALAGPTPAFGEVKLHDDIGDLELWLATDPAIAAALDLPLDARPSVTFESLGGRVVVLAPRDANTNPDEDGKANIREGKTNYFVFPGTSGADASALKGADFKSQVQVSVPAPGGALTGALTLKPHSHSHGPGGHQHPHGH